MKKELSAILDTVEECRANTIFFQVRPSSDALYASSIFPVSRWLTGEEGSKLPDGFDPLEWLVFEAHKRGIFIYAWINPLRVTVGSASKPAHDLNALAPDNPARLHPEWTVAYDDGQIYYDPGVPEVRELVASGVREVVSGYHVDGVIFDDYFYPYPVSGGVFHDEASYAMYGRGADLGDWRRENVDKLVALCYEAVKSVYADCRFGVAPFGIWKNDDGKNGGSATGGLQSYSAIYCDTTAWIRGGYIDFVAPQIYWSFDSKAAPYGVLVDWWDALLADYPSVDLLITHAAYRASEWGEDEIPSQVTYARSKRSYAGSSFYGYAAIEKNEAKLKERFVSLFADILYPRRSDR